MPNRVFSRAARSPQRASAALLMVLFLFLAGPRPGSWSLAGGGAPACGCKPGASCCLLLAKLGKKCCSHPHGGKAAGRCSLGSGENPPAGAPAQRELAGPKAVALSRPATFVLPIHGHRPPRDRKAPSLPGREPPDPPPRFS